MYMFTQACAHDSDVGVGGARALGNALRHNAGVRALLLGENRFESSGASGIAGALKANTALEELCLENNGVELRGATALGKALAGNKTLRILRIGWNWLGEAGAKAIAQSIGRCVSLRPALDGVRVLLWFLTGWVRMVLTRIGAA